jgi:hypothetical protein
MPGRPSAGSVQEPEVIHAGGKRVSAAGNRAVSSVRGVVIDADPPSLIIRLIPTLNEG